MMVYDGGDVRANVVLYVCGSLLYHASGLVCWSSTNASTFAESVAETVAWKTHTAVM